MDPYAQNFKREGVNSHEDLVWFAKLENYRYYTYNDPEVKQGLKKRGERKEGEQLHVQVIVSRKDATNTIKLSPMNTSRGRNEEHSKKMGQFDRVAFKLCGETLFDELFEFDRQLKETMAYANTKKNGVEDRVKMETLKLETVELTVVNERQKGADLNRIFTLSVDYAAPIGISIADEWMTRRYMARIGTGIKAGGVSLFKNKSYRAIVFCFLLAGLDILLDSCCLPTWRKKEWCVQCIN